MGFNSAFKGLSRLVAIKCIVVQVIVVGLRSKMSLLYVEPKQLIGKYC